MLREVVRLAALFGFGVVLYYALALVAVLSAMGD